jgi:hypothetical protein
MDVLREDEDGWPLTTLNNREAISGLRYRIGRVHLLEHKVDTGYMEHEVDTRSAMHG